MKVAAEQNKLTLSAKLRFTGSLDRFLSKSNLINLSITSQERIPVGEVCPNQRRMDHEQA
jgi:hypothetical protein